MASIFERTKSPVSVHILHDETLTERNRSLLTETAEMFAREVEFHNVTTYIEQLGDDTNRFVQKSAWSVGTLYRLAITDILPLDKVIYLDCDIVVNMDIRELWDISVEECSCAGVLDIPHGRFSSTTLGRRLMGCDPKKYVNAGVLLMNIPRMKEKLDIRQVCRWFERYRYCMNFQDQDLINSCFRGEIKFLEGRFNNRRAPFRDDVYTLGVEDSIFHATLTKPWNEPTGSFIDRLYWRAFLKTPWGRLPHEELVDLIIDIFQKSPLTHRRTSQCYRKVFHRLRKDICANDIFRTAALFFKALFHETKYLFTRGESKKI
ncbi:MAG: glycosyltransferase family 8 protein [Synergistaceae bacterium]|nr:glycosyltransferase family 8 protein [Synergistaceae bacterium]